jgi:hypothetical protein
VRTYGRIYSEDGSYTWTVVTTDANGQNDQVYLTTLNQCLKLNLNESPMFSTLGIPAQQSVLTQVFPDYYTNQIVQYFRPFFASLSVTKVDAKDSNGVPYPAYQISAITNQGAVLSETIPV